LPPLYINKFLKTGALVAIQDNVLLSNNKDVFLSLVWSLHAMQQAAQIRHHF